MRAILIFLVSIAVACGREKAMENKGLKDLDPSHPKQPLPGPTPGPAPGTATEATVIEILRKHCAPCHGDSGSSDGGFDYASDLTRLARSTLVEPGNAAASRLIQRVASGSMPPPGVTAPLTIPELAALKAWIDEGAGTSEAQRRRIAPAEVKGWVDDDFAKLSAKDKAKVIYFDMSHIYGGSTASHADIVRRGFFKFINSVSSASEIVAPVALNAEKTLFRVKLESFGWQESDFSQLLAMHPYPLDSTREQLVVAPGFDTAVPRAAPLAPGAEATPRFLRIDWFLKTASRAPFYYELLDTPSRLLLLEQKLGIDTVKNLEEAAVVRAGFANSQVASQQRIIERHPSPSGAYWRTFEFGSSQGVKNVFQNPLGPGSIFADVSDKRFVADGHEVIYHLKNGLLAFAIFDGDGNRLDIAPSGQIDGIKENSTINVGVSCMACHNAGFVDKQDQISASISAGDFSKDERALITSLYKEATTISGHIKADSRRFHASLAELEVDPKADDPVSSSARRYMEPMTVDEAAAYLGLEASELVSKIKESEFLGALLAGHVAADAIDRQVWEQNFRQIVSVLENGEPEVLALPQTVND